MTHQSKTITPDHIDPDLRPTSAILKDAMPFHIHFDHSDQILGYGRSLQKLVPGLARTSKLSQIIRWQEKDKTTAFLKSDDAKRLQTRIYLKGLESHSLKGEIIATDLPHMASGHSPEFILNIGFGIEVTKIISDFDLNAEDFSFADPSMEILYLFQLQNLLLSESQNLITRLDDARAQARTDALFDPLTGLKNRRGVEHFVENLTRRSYSGEITVIQLDLDRFKPINDTHGHDAGDLVLKMVARRISEEMRSTDLIARLGGDEFLIAIPRTLTPDLIEGIAKRIIETVAEPIEVEGLNLSVGVSAGGIVKPFQEVSFQDLLNEADQALYRAKESGRGRFVLQPSN